MIVRKLRLENGWSQEHLAEISGLSIRTIQRVERGQKASLETIKSLAAVFEVDFYDLSKELPMNNSDNENDKKNENIEKISITTNEAETLEYVRDIKGFYSHVIKYAIVISILFVIDLLTSPGKLWFYWPAIGWGIGLIVHGTSVFEIMSIFGPKWEKRQIERRLRRKSRK